MRTYGSCIRNLGIIILLVAAAGSSALAQRMTSGPVPPPGIDRGLREPSRAQVIIPGTPAYIWHHGCGPTATGMIIGYYDTHGYADLVPGSAATQTAAVNAMMTNDSGHANCSLADGDHYQDYSCPRDDNGPAQVDRSELGGAHQSNCVGDFMRTSWSSAGNLYGWSWGSDIVPAFVGYVSYAAPSYSIDAQTRSFFDITWEEYKAEIDANHPVGLLVDTDGDGQTDHFITGIGYNDVTLEYACRDTWDTGVHWFDWSWMGSGNPWGIYNVTTYFFYPLPDLTVLDLELQPANPVCPDSVAARAHVINQGGMDADWFWVQFHSNGVLAGNYLAMSLAHGADLWTDWISLGIKLQGTHNVQACLDVSYMISEGDETNNCLLENFEVGTCPAAVPGEPGVAQGGLKGMQINLPNPYQANQWIALDSSASGEAFVAVYDAVGRQVRLLFSAPVSSGQQLMRWDGRAENGEMVPSGVYFVQARIGAARTQRTVIFQR